MCSRFCFSLTKTTVRVYHPVVLRAEDEKSFCTQLSALSTYAFMCTHVLLYAYKDAYTRHAFTHTLLSPPLKPNPVLDPGPCMNSGNSLKVMNHCCLFKVKTLRPTATTIVLRTRKHWVRYYFKTTAPHTSHAAKEGYAQCGRSNDTDVMVWVWVQPAEKGWLHCDR